MGAGHFNKGSTMNAAAKEAINRGFDCIVLHDVDMLLEDDRNIYQCQDGPVHLSPFIDKFHYKDHYGTEFGGVTMLKKEHYLASNGYSNLFWGWGKEDDDMVYRVKAAGLEIRKPVNYDSGRYSMFPHQHPWAFRNNRITDKNSDLRFLSLQSIGKAKTRAKFEGISSIEYKVKKVPGMKTVMAGKRPTRAFPDSSTLDFRGIFRAESDSDSPEAFFQAKMAQNVTPKLVWYLCFLGGRLH